MAVLTPFGLRSFEVHAEFVTYLKVARELPQQLLSRELDRYYAGRILPSAAAYALTGLLGWSHDTPNTLTAYALINIVLAGLIAAGYCRLADRLRFSVTDKLFGYVSLFGTFVFWHHFPFVTATSDTWGLLFTLWMLDAYLAGSRWKLGILLVLGAFTWPTLLLGCGLFLALPFQGFSEPVETNSGRRFAAVLAVLIAAAWVVSAGYMLRKGLPTAVIFRVETLPLAPLAIGVTLAYLLPALYLVFNDARLFRPSDYLSRISPRGVFTALLLATGATFVKRLYSHAGGQDLKIYWGTHVAQTPLFKPGNFLLANVLFWGPVFILLVLHWPAVSRQVRRIGPALVAYIAAGILSSIHADSRMSMSFVPLLILLAVPTIRQSARGRSAYLLYIAASVLLSKAWVAAQPLPFGTAEDWWWATYGTWMTNRMYFIQGLVLLPVMVLIGYYFRPMSPHARRSDRLQAE